jgi:phage shock protein C
MNKVVNVNIGGMVFTLDENAYQSLQNYLKQLKDHFNKEDGGDDIMSDIEQGIASILFKKLSTIKTIIDISDVESALHQMGKIEEIIGKTDDKQEGSSQTNHTFYGAEKNKRRFYRDEDNNVIGGVCSGLGAYFDIDPVIIRVIFIVLLLIGGSALLIYGILWIAIPKAETLAQKMEMKGEKLNVENISKNISDAFNNIDTNDVKNKAKGFFGKLIDVIVTIAGSLGKFIFRVISFVFITVAIFIIIAIVLSFMGGPTFLSSDDFLFNQENMQLTYIALFFALIIPCLVLIIKIIRKLLGYKANYNKRIEGVIAFCSFIIGIGIFMYISNDVYQQFRYSKTESKIFALNNVTSDTLTINAVVSENQNITSKFKKSFNVQFEDEDIRFSSNKPNPYLQIKRSYDDTFRLEVTSSSRGKSKQEVDEILESINNTHQVYGNDKLTIDNTIKSDRQIFAHYLQATKYTLYVPNRKYVFFAPSTKYFIYDIDNVDNTYDQDMIGYHWQMIGKELAPANDFIQDAKPKRNEGEWKSK